MKCNLKPYRLQRRDGLFIGRHPNGQWCYTSDILSAAALSEQEVKDVMNRYVPHSEWEFWNVLTLCACIDTKDYERG